MRRALPLALLLAACPKGDKPVSPTPVREVVSASSVDPEPWIKPICKAPTMVPDLVLPELGGEPTDTPRGVQILVGGDGVRVDRTAVGSDEELSAALAEALAGYGGPGEVPVLLLADYRSPADELEGLIGAVAAVGVPELWVGGSSSAIWSPEGPDPVYAAELDALLAGYPLDERAEPAAEALSQLAGECDAIGEMFRSVGYMPPETRCEGLAVGLRETLPACPGVPGEQFVVATQRLLLAEAPLAPRSLPVDLRGGVPPRGVAQSWAEYALVLGGM